MSINVSVSCHRLRFQNNYELFKEISLNSAASPVVGENNVCVQICHQASGMWKEDEHVCDPVGFSCRVSIPGSLNA